MLPSISDLEGSFSFCFSQQLLSSFQDLSAHNNLNHGYPIIVQFLLSCPQPGPVLCGCHCTNYPVLHCAHYSAMVPSSPHSGTSPYLFHKSMGVLNNEGYGRS